MDFEAVGEQSAGQAGIDVEQVDEARRPPARRHTSSKPSSSETSSARATLAGRKAAKSRGVRFGRPPKLNAEQEQLARRLIGEGRPVGEIARTFKVHVATIYRLSGVPA